MGRETWKQEWEILNEESERFPRDQSQKWTTKTDEDVKKKTQPLHTLILTAGSTHNEDGSDNCIMTCRNQLQWKEVEGAWR